MKGKLYGIGVGPGDPELLTLKAKRILEEVDIICTPQSKRGKDSVALEIIKKVVEVEGRVKELSFPMTRDKKRLNRAWDRAAEEVAQFLDEGNNVAFITLGDPLLYSTYIYILERVKRNHPYIEVETVPGITSISACVSRVNRALAQGDEEVHIIPAAYGAIDLEGSLRRYDNIVLMKVNRNYDKIVELLKRHNLEKKAIFISRCGQKDEFITSDLESLVGKKLDYLSMIIVNKN